MSAAVDKALGILDLLESARSGGTSLAEIADAANLPKPTAHRLLASLEARGYVHHAEAGRYTLGPRLISLGQVAAAGSTLQSLARPVLDRLVEVCGETVHLGVLHGDVLMYIDRREPQDVAVRLATLPSPMSTLHASASGKVLLAFADPASVEQVISAGLPRYTETTLSDADALRRELGRVRAQGYAINEQERFVGVRAVAVPVHRRDGTVAAALSAAGPIQRVDEAALERLRDHLLAAATRLTTLLP